MYQLNILTLQPVPFYDLISGLKKCNTIVNTICNLHKNLEGEEGWSVDTQCSGGLCEIGSGEAMCTAEMPTLRLCSGLKHKLGLWTGKQTLGKKKAKMCGR